MSASPPVVPARTRVPVPARADAVVGAVLDGALECAVLAFAWWTLLYHLALVAHLAPSVLLMPWLAGTVTLVVLRVRLRRRAAPVHGRALHTAAALLAAVTAVVASCIVRPDLDDASYLARTVWVAERDDLGVRDVIVSWGEWPALSGQSPYLPSFETLLGALARATGLRAGTVTYLVVVPLAAFAATWALWTVLRAWRVQLPLAALALALVFLLWGGATHASWGNLSFARIWQGKIPMLTVVVPVAYAWCAAYWRSTPGARRRWALVLVAAAGMAAVGMSPTGVFVLPEVVVVAAVAGVLARRWGRAAALVLAGCAYPLAAGVVTRLAGNVDTSADSLIDQPLPWERTLGAGWEAAVVVVAVAAVLVGAVRPRWSGLGSPTGRVTAVAAVAAGALLGLGPVYDVVTSVMGTDAIAWRTVWVVPLPALVGALAGFRAGSRWTGPVLATGAAAGLVLGGLPLWSAQNHATWTTTPQWKVAEPDLRTARWLAANAPRDGRYLARLPVVAATGSVTSELLPVSSRGDYMLQYADLPGSAVPDRLTLQQWADDPASAPAAPRDVRRLLDELDVTALCVPGDRAAADLGAGWRQAEVVGTDGCWLRR